MNVVGEWAATCLYGLAGAGVTDVVVSPGSRSTPLVLAAAAEPRVRVLDVVDERSAAFVALGQARVTGRPTLLVCTSGSAPAHYHPAVIEADRGRVPLLVLSADRPWELHDAGANQTVDQAKLFGAAVRGFFDIGAPDPHPTALRGVLRVAAQAAALAVGPVPGPVHLNARFRKPLEPGPAVTEADRRAEAVGAELRSRPAPRVIAPRPRLEPGDAADVIELLRGARAPLLVAGPNGALPAGDADAVLALARRLGAPLLPEATSQLRFTGRDRSGVATLDGFEALLRTDRGRAALVPDVVLQLGGAPVSGQLPAHLEVAAPNAARVAVAPHGWTDPDNRATHLVRAPVGELARAVLDALPGGPAPTGGDPVGARGLQRAADAAIEGALAETGWTESRLAAALPRWLPSGARLLLGNSLPIRQVDLFAMPTPGHALHVGFQRGASGIDGLVAGAAGTALASGDPTVLLLGDVSFQHDVGSLAVARHVAAAPLVIVVVQNGGGRIFEMLPVARQGLDPAVLDHFVTPTVGFDPCAAAAAFGVAATRVHDEAGAEAAVRAAVGRPGPTLVEVVVPPDGARRATAALVARLDAALPGP